MVVMGLLLIFGERCLGLSIFYATFVSYYYRWQTPLCCELCVLHCQSLLHIIVAGFDVAANYTICTVGDASHLLYPCNYIRVICLSTQSQSSLTNNFSICIHLSEQAARQATSTLFCDCQSTALGKRLCQPQTTEEASKPTNDYVCHK